MYPVETVSIIVQLIFLEGILSIDNAAVLGAMVAHLPTRDGVPWPGFLRAAGRILDPILGRQRSAALKVGLLGAYAGRGLMLLLATVIINNPWLRLLGAAYLLKIAIGHLGKAGTPDEDDASGSKRLGRSFWSTVLMVELADLAFSLDNVVAAVSLSRQLWVVLVGVALGILTMRFAATGFTYLIEREPILVDAAFLLILNIGLESLLSEFWAIEFPPLLKFGVSIATLVLVVAYAHLQPMQVLRPLVRLGRRLFVLLDQAIGLVFRPLGIVSEALFGLIRGRLPVQRGDG